MIIGMLVNLLLSKDTWKGVNFLLNDSIFRPEISEIISVNAKTEFGA